MPSTRVLVGDLGGTNVRFAVARYSGSERPLLSDEVRMKTADFGSLEEAVGAYCARIGGRPELAVIDVAGPVVGGEVKMTNLSWIVSEHDLRRQGFRDVVLINDFRALAAAAEVLDESDLVPIASSARYDPAENVAILGAGTGLGVSALVHEDNAVLAVSSEGGHSGFAPGNDLEIDILRVLRDKFGHVSAERLLSGPGLVNLYESLCTLRGVAAQFDDPAAISAEAERGPGLCREAVEVFCGILGSLAGDLALTFTAKGGVLLAGGVTTSLHKFLEAGSFRARFEDKGRLGSYLRNVPTFLIATEDAALRGCARTGQKRFSANASSRSA